MPGCTQEQRVSENTPELQGFYLPPYQQVSEVILVNALEGTEKASYNPSQKVSLVAQPT